MKRVASLAVMVAVAAALAGCGIPTDQKFRGVSPDEVPFGLAAVVTTTRPGTTTTVVQLPRPSAIETVTIYYVVGQSLLVPVDRELDKPASLGTVIASLAVGPRLAEQEHGYRSVVRFGHVVNVDSRGGVGTIDLSPSFLDLASSEQRLAIAQLVFTLTARPGIGQVVFSLEGASIAVPLPDGSLVSGAITRELYPSMIFTPATTTTEPPLSQQRADVDATVLGNGR